MTKIAKLYANMLAGRLLTFAEFQRVLEAFGYRLDRINGSHHTYRHPLIAQRMQIQPRGKDAKVYQIDQFRLIIARQGLSLDESDD